MHAIMNIRLAAAVVVGLLASAHAPAHAQDWSVYGGVAARVEYNDNYFFTAPAQGVNAGAQPQWGVTASVIPFVTAARRTEDSEVSAFAAIGGNKVWGPSPSSEYWSGNFALDGTLRDGVSRWTGRATFSRNPQLQTIVGDPGAVLGLAYTDLATVRGEYSRSIAERWTAGVNAGAYANHYDAVQTTGTLSNNHGFTGGGNLDYDYSDQTRISSALGYAYYTSDRTDNNSLTATLTAYYRLSPQLTLSASGGWFWTDATAQQPAIGVPLPPSLSDRARSDGPLVGGSIAYVGERARFAAALTQSLAPNGSGALGKIEDVSATYQYDFSEYVTGRIGATYQRITFPAIQSDAYDSDTLGAQVGLTYRFAERWRLEAGYQYTRAHYQQISGEPRSNVFFATIAYNWPGGSSTAWTGRAPDTQGFVGAGPIAAPDASRPTPPPGAPERSPFEPFTLP